VIVLWVLVGGLSGSVGLCLCGGVVFVVVWGWFLGGVLWCFFGGDVVEQSELRLSCFLCWLTCGHGCFSIEACSLPPSKETVLTSLLFAIGLFFSLFILC